MEGILSVPPERNIISRGNWKHRYVVLAPSTATPVSPTSATALSGKIGNVSEENVSASVVDYTLAVYKSKTDTEPLVVYPSHAIQTCYVGDVAQRKAFGSISKPSFEPLIPTMIIQLKSCSVSKPQRRKSHINIESLKLDISRDHSSFSVPVTLLFRAGPPGQPALVSWAKEIQTRVNGIQTMMDRRSSSPTVNVISKSARSRNTVYGDPRSDSRLHFKTLDPEIGSSDAASSSRLSLRSESSGTNSDEVSIFSGTASTPLSPAVIMSTSDDDDAYQQQQSSRHRSYTVDGSSQVVSSEANSPQSSKAESILDRAFKLNYIPSSPTSSPLEADELTSVARFEALAVDPERLSSSYNFSIDQSIMPPSFFEESPSNKRSNKSLQVTEHHGNVQSAAPDHDGIKYHKTRRGNQHSNTIRALSPFGNRMSLSESILKSPSPIDGASFDAFKENSDIDSHPTAGDLSIMNDIKDSQSSRRQSRAD